MVVDMPNSASVIVPAFRRSASPRLSLPLSFGRPVVRPIALFLFEALQSGRLCPGLLISACLFPCISITAPYRWFAPATWPTDEILRCGSFLCQALPFGMVPGAAALLVLQVGMARAELLPAFGFGDAARRSHWVTPPRRCPGIC